MIAIVTLCAPSSQHRKVFVYLYLSQYGNSLISEKGGNNDKDSRITSSKTNALGPSLGAVFTNRDLIKKATHAAIGTAVSV